MGTTFMRIHANGTIEAQGVQVSWNAGKEYCAGDIIVYENESDLPEISKTKRLFRSDGSGIKEIQIS